MFILQFLLMSTNLGMSGEIAVSDNFNKYKRLWKIQSECEKTHIVSNFFNHFDVVTIDGATYSGKNDEIDLFVPNSFFVGLSFDNLTIVDEFILLWKCYHQGS